MQIFSSLRLWELLLDNKTCDSFSQTVINWSAFLKWNAQKEGNQKKMLNRMGYDHVKLLAGVYDELNCFRHLVALYFLCESFPAKQAEDIKRVKRFNIGGGWNIYFSWKKGKRNKLVLGA